MNYSEVSFLIFWCHKHDYGTIIERLILLSFSVRKKFKNDGYKRHLLQLSSNNDIVESRVFRKQNLLLIFRLFLNNILIIVMDIIINC